jgi:hypothetical protein
MFSIAFAWGQTREYLDRREGGKAAAACAEAVRPITETAHLSTRAAADALNHSCVTTASGKQWDATRVHCARQSSRPMIEWRLQNSGVK